MITTTCLLILAYILVGKDIKPLLKKLKNVDWQSVFSEVFDKIKIYSKKVGRVATKTLLTFYFVLKDGDLSLTEKAMIYGCILYVISPVSIIPQSVFKILGVMDESAAVLFVYKKIKSKITPTIMEDVECTLNKWFDEVKYIEVE
ncbi:MAG: DUF1232 domain-containing protein [Bacteroidales bacterium]|nr:DUF1232 domain-containing protein [Bacteroidales bacterium]